MISQRNNNIRIAILCWIIRNSRIDPRPRQITGLWQFVADDRAPLLTGLASCGGRSSSEVLHRQRSVVEVVVVVVVVSGGAGNGVRGRRALRHRAAVRREEPSPVGHHATVQHQLERGDKVEHVEHHDRDGWRLIARLRSVSAGPEPRGPENRWTLPTYRPPPLLFGSPSARQRATGLPLCRASHRHASTRCPPRRRVTITGIIIIIILRLYNRYIIVYYHWL